MQMFEQRINNTKIFTSFSQAIFSWNSSACLQTVSSLQQPKRYSAFPMQIFHSHYHKYTLINNDYSHFHRFKKIQGFKCQAPCKNQAEQKRKSITICNIKLFKFAIIWILNWITVNCFKDKLCVFSLCFSFNCTPYIIQKSKREIFADVETWTDTTTTGEEKN